MSNILFYGGLKIIPIPNITQILGNIKQYMYKIHHNISFAKNAS